jgi:hypothetical protein
MRWGGDTIYIERGKVDLRTWFYIWWLKNYCEKLLISLGWEITTKLCRIFIRRKKGNNTTGADQPDNYHYKNQPQQQETTNKTKQKWRKAPNKGCRLLLLVVVIWLVTWLGEEICQKYHIEFTDTN